MDTLLILFVAACASTATALTVSPSTGRLSRLRLPPSEARLLPSLVNGVRRRVPAAVRTHPRAGVAAQHRGALIELCFALSDELRAGRAPVDALRRAVEFAPPDRRGLDLTQVFASERMGVEVASTLRWLGERQGLEGLRRLAACWRVGASSGAGFADAVDRLAKTLRAEEEHKREVAAQLAGTRATARLLAALPLLGLLMSVSVGTHPVSFLTGTGYGVVCLTGGAVLDVVGVLWTQRMARAAEETQ